MVQCLISAECHAIELQETTKWTWPRHSITNSNDMLGFSITCRCSGPGNHGDRFRIETVADPRIGVRCSVTSRSTGCPPNDEINGSDLWTFWAKHCSLERLRDCVSVYLFHAFVMKGEESSTHGGVPQCFCPNTGKQSLSQHSSASRAR